jgi:predicted cation transporter
MGLASALISRVLSAELLKEIFHNELMYMITAAVLLAGFLFKLLKEKLKASVGVILKSISLRLFVFLIIVVLGLASSIITAIISSLILVEIISILPLTRTKKIEINIVACFAIGLGAALTPVGEPISTIVISKLDENFWYIMNQLGIYVIPGILLLGLLGMWLVGDKRLKNLFISTHKTIIERELDEVFGAENFDVDEDTLTGILHRTAKIFIFIIALELLGAGFRPIIDTYIIKLDSRLLYWGNIVSAILDNATLAAAEISIKMSPSQIRAILMGLLISGGMLIPGNIPNIVSAGKLKIKSSEWIRLGLPLGLLLLLIYYIILFVL